MDDASMEPTIMPLDLLREITDDFSEQRELGRGSFGKVYLGEHRDGKRIAVKKLYDMPGLDDKHFQNEFKNLSSLRHENIVQLVGYCHDIQEVQVKHEGKWVVGEKTHRALCLEYMSNGSLDKYLSDECEKYDWHKGYRIIKGICQGLKYLHNELKPPIYHLDLKPANILLDEKMVPRIADFGISRLFEDERTRATKSSLGTIGYLPPEYIKNNLVSNKFDIFSLGVVIIKIMAGHAGYFNSAEMSSKEFTDLVQKNWTNRLLETSNRRNAYSEQVKMCIEIGLSCVQEDRHKRPTIQDIVNRLEETETKCNYAARAEYSQYPLSSEQMLTEDRRHNVGRGLAWSLEENKLFEEALAQVDRDRWERVAALLPGKTVADVMMHYDDLENNEENRLFEEVLAQVDTDAPDRQEQVALLLPGKTVLDVMMHYDDVDNNVSFIEAGIATPFPHYNCGDGRSAAAWRSSALATQSIGGTRGRGNDYEHKRVPWIEEEHN